MNKCESCDTCQSRPKTWSDMVKMAIEELKKFDVRKECKGDRLCMAKKIQWILLMLNQSLKGWASWMNFERMDTLTKEEMEWLCEELSKVVIEFLKIDHDITKRKEEEHFTKMKEMLEKAQKEARKAHRTKKGTGYIQ